ncbi:MAG: cobalamin B12-binding domain-containing protein [Candidatus Omnitrophica bacterium]|nr:cobalamin B12-binding domain-containing protein [Candidatus Omnitrophota bacterium]
MPTSKRELDCLLINPGSRSLIYQGLGRNLSAIEPPVWAGLMATTLRRKGFSVEILDADAGDLSAQEVAKGVAERSPLLTAVVVYGHQPSASTQNMTAAGEICAAVKEGSPDRKILLVGGHVAALPERTLREEEADFVCGGEGPVTMAELLQALSSDRPEDLKKVRGLLYWEGEKIQVNPPAPLVKNLDEEMPEVAWDLLPMEKYRAHNWHCFQEEGLNRQPYAALYTTLGCPFHCSFCCIQAPFKSGEKTLGWKEGINSYRYWSVKAVLGQLETLITRYGVRNVKIADEMFVLNPQHVMGICEGIRERGLSVNIWAYARVDTVRDGMVEKLKAAGVNWLAFGIEAANSKVRDDVQKGFGQEKIFDTLEKVRKAGIHVIGNYIFGLPEDTFQTMQETLDLALELNCEFANFYSAMAYPGSQLYPLALKEGWPLPQKWSGYSQHAVDALPLPTKHLSAGEVLKFRDRAFQVYFNDPRYLERVKRTFGEETLQHIREMVSQPLARKPLPRSDGKAFQEVLG